MIEVTTKNERVMAVARAIVAVGAMMSAVVAGTGVAVAGGGGGVEWRQCRNEDGSGQRRCVWDARHAGNGVGDSFKVYRGGTKHERVVYLSHRRAHALLAR